MIGVIKMDRKDRKRLDDWCKFIVPKINMEKLLPKLIENKVYNKDDVNIQRWKVSLITLILCTNKLNYTTSNVHI